jgi:stalled ribosome rescue protein Dom34
MSDHQVAIWIDQHEAHIFRVDNAVFETSTVHAPEHVRRHPQREAEPHNHPDDEPRFFSDVARAVMGADRVLVVGPSTAKLHFRDYVQSHESTLKLQIVGVETVDHPTDKQLAAYVRQYFRDKEQAERPVPPRSS